MGLAILSRSGNNQGENVCVCVCISWGSKVASNTSLSNQHLSISQMVREILLRF